MCNVCKKEQVKDPSSLSPSDAMKVDKVIKLGKYDRIIVGKTEEGIDAELIVDVYDVLAAFNITNQALGHGLKKALCPGQRGVKPAKQDIDEAIQSLERAKRFL